MWYLLLRPSKMKQVKTLPISFQISNLGVFGLHILPFFDKFVSRGSRALGQNRLSRRSSPPSSMRFNDFSAIENGLEQLLLDLAKDGDFSDGL